MPCLNFWNNFDNCLEVMWMRNLHQVLLLYILCSLLLNSLILPWFTLTLTSLIKFDQKFWGNVAEGNQIPATSSVYKNSSSTSSEKLGHSFLVFAHFNQPRLVMSGSLYVFQPQESVWVQGSMTMSFPLPWEQYGINCWTVFHLRFLDTSKQWIKLPLEFHFDWKVFWRMRFPLSIKLLC